MDNLFIHTHALYHLVKLVLNMRTRMNSKKERPLAAAYIRVSTRDQKDEGLSLEVQEKLCRERAERDGYDLLEILNDGGISGHEAERPGLNRIRELITENKVQAVVALSSDRIFRNSRAHMEFMDLVFKYQIRLLYVSGATPEDNATSKMSDRVLATINQFYRDQISDKVKDTLYAKAEAGYYPTKPPPGYTNIEIKDAVERLGKRVIIPDPVMGPIITEMFQLYSTGTYSVYVLADMMYAKGLRNRKDGKISTANIYYMLKNRTYVGEVSWGTVHGVVGKHEPLADRLTFNRVQEVMTTHNRKACRRRKYQWLLAGFLTCATHERRYCAEWHMDKKVAYYHCSNPRGCGKYCEQVQMEQLVAEKFKDLQFSDEFTAEVVAEASQSYLEQRNRYDGRRQGLVNRKTALEDKRRVVEEKLIAGTLSDEDYTRMSGDIKKDIKQITDALAELESEREMDIEAVQEILLVSRNIYAAYKKASFDLKRQYLSFFWDHFEIHNGVILSSIPSALFADLLKAEKAFYKSPKSQKGQKPSDSGPVILKEFLLRDLGSNQDTLLQRQVSYR